MSIISPVNKAYISSLERNKNNVQASLSAISNTPSKENKDTLTILKNKKEKQKKILVLLVGLSICAGIVACILKNKKLPEPQGLIRTIEDFKQTGGYFEKGTAKTSKGEPFSGSFTVENKNGKFSLNYIDGKLIQSRQNDNNDCLNQIKDYIYIDGKLAEVDITDKNYNKIIKRTFSDTQTQQFVWDFTRTTEGKRRAKQTNDEILKEAQIALEKFFKEKGLDEKFLPTIEMKTLERRIGEYDPGVHKIHIDPNCIKKGLAELEEVVGHEATHAHRDILIGTLDVKTTQKLTKTALLERIKGQELDMVYSGTETLSTPKMSEKMKKDFSNFAASHLYITLDNAENTLDTLSDSKRQQKVLEELSAKIKALIQDNPDFIDQFSSEEQAQKALSSYSLSHMFRYNLALYSQSKTEKMHRSYLHLLKPNTDEAKQALIENMREQEVLYVNNKYGYHFCNEEAQSEIFGASFAIKRMQEKIKKLNPKDKNTPALKENYEYAIKTLKEIIGYRKKGEAWYIEYINSLNNPNNQSLQNKVEQGLQDLRSCTPRSGIIPNGTHKRIHPKN